MFIYFNQNKLAYHKGQLVPFFIVFIIAVIIAALVTVNIGKVAKTKTYSANAADAGALAAASTMASAFNYLAVANSQMIVNYQYFFAMATISFTIGYVAMATAMTKTSLAMTFLALACKYSKCCPKPWCCALWGSYCADALAALAVAAGSMELFNDTMKKLLVTVTGYWMTQYYFYRMIRENVADYYQGALESGYSFAFNNSGAASKLKGCRLEDISLCDACEKACDRDCKGRCGVRSDCIDSDGEYDNDCLKDYGDCQDTCSREELNCLIDNCDSQKAEYQLWVKDNIDDVANSAIKNYTWLDGQSRSHDVAVQVAIEPIERYVLRIAMLPFPLEIAALALAWYFGSEALGFLGWADTAACPFPCTAVGIAGLALASEIKGLVASIAAHAGLLVNGTFTSSSAGDVLPYLITGIDEVPDNPQRLVEVIQTQRYQGADFGVWSTEYPLTTSSAQACFAGDGKIDSPHPYYDASIVLTDFSDHLLEELAVPIKDIEE
ncbi:MAG: pilus assembly protein TadG-related protein [Candidatus Omnitrophota bacterium]